MKFFASKTAMNTSRDAKSFAPSFCSAKNEMNNVFFMDIALAVSFLFCLIPVIIEIILRTIRIIMIKLKKKSYIGQPLSVCM